MTLLYVRPFPNVDTGKWEVSRGGGRQPLWSASGRELFYRGPDKAIVGVTVKTVGITFEAGPPVTLVRGAYCDGGGGIFGRTYDVSGDGKRFLMIKQSGVNETEVSPTITVVQNWTDELKRLVPTK